MKHLGQHAMFIGGLCNVRVCIMTLGSVEVEITWGQHWVHQNIEAWLQGYLMHSLTSQPKHSDSLGSSLTTPGPHRKKLGFSTITHLYRHSTTMTWGKTWTRSSVGARKNTEKCCTSVSPNNVVQNLRICFLSLNEVDGI